MDEINSKPEQSGLTKKQELNNHIVSMRGFIRQAKVHVVRKLTREATKLKERKGSEEIRQKCQRKAERLVQEILSIKNLDIDKVSVAALRNKSTLVEVLQSAQSSPEDRGCARLIHHPAVQLQVKKYRDANPHWRLQIPVLLEKTPQKLKKSQKKQEEKLARKKRVAGARNGSSLGDSVACSSSEENVEPDEDKKEELPKGQPFSEDKKEKLPKGQPLSEDKKEKLPKGQLMSEESGKPKGKVKSKKTEPAKVNKPEPETKLPPKSKVDEILAAIPLKKQVSEEKLNKIKGTVKVQVLKTLDDLETDSKADLEELKSDDKPKTKPKSSFFIGGEDEESDNAVESEEEYSEPADNHSKRFGKGNFGRPSQNKFNEKKSGGLAWKQHSKPPSRYFDKPAPFKPARAIPQREPQKPTVSAPVEKLHPSWEAKKRQSIGITSFQGKKIKFDD